MPLLIEIITICHRHYRDLKFKDLNKYKSEKPRRQHCFPSPPFSRSAKIYLQRSGQGPGGTAQYPVCLTRLDALLSARARTAVTLAQKGTSEARSPPGAGEGPRPPGKAEVVRGTWRHSLSHSFFVEGTRVPGQSRFPWEKTYKRVTERFFMAKSAFLSALALFIQGRAKVGLQL